MKIQVAAQALKDLADIADYVNARNPGAAKIVASELQRAIDRLALHPLSRRAQDASGIRQLVEPRFRYLIYYEVDDEGVFVLSVRHPARERPYQDN